MTRCSDLVARLRLARMGNGQQATGNGQLALAEHAPFPAVPGFNAHREFSEILFLRAAGAIGCWMSLLPVCLLGIAVERAQRANLRRAMPSGQLRHREVRRGDRGRSRRQRQRRRCARAVIEHALPGVAQGLAAHAEAPFTRRGTYRSLRRGLCASEHHDGRGRPRGGGGTRGLAMSRPRDSKCARTTLSARVGFVDGAASMRSGASSCTMRCAIVHGGVSVASSRKRPVTR